MRLFKPKDQIQKIFEDLKPSENSEIKNHLLQLEELISIIWAYRNAKEGCFLERETLASMCHTSVSTIKRLTKWLRNNDLVIIVTKFYDNKTRNHYWPSDVLKDYINKKAKGPAEPLLGAPWAHYNPSSKEEGKKQTTRSVGAFVAPPRREDVCPTTDGYDVNELETIMPLIIK